MKVFICSATNAPISLVIWEGTFLDIKGNANTGLVFAMMTPIVNTSGLITGDKKLVDVSGKTTYGTTSFDKFTTKTGDSFTLQSANLYTLKVIDTPDISLMPQVNSKPRQPSQVRPAPQSVPGASTNPAQGEVMRQNQQMIDYVNSIFNE